MTLTKVFTSAAATVLVAAAVVLLPAGEATAAGCSGSTGVTVVVDSNELGAGISAGCDADGGGVAASNFADAGYTIEYSQAAGMDGFVCKVGGRPADGDCTTATSYWSLWWSDGRTGTWTYASRGVNSLKVSVGGYVAFAWHQGSGQAAPPDVAPTARVVDPTTATPTAVAPSPAATKKPGGAKTSKPKPSTFAVPSTTATPTATATPTDASTSATPSESTATPTETAPTETPSPTSTTGLPSIDEITDGPDSTRSDASTKDDDGGFPAWLGIGLVVIVLGAAGAVPILRRRNG